jgi:hypothetical protein
VGGVGPAVGVSDLTARHKPAGVIAVAVAHRAHRLAFALMRTGSTFDAARWAESVTHQGERRERQAGRARQQYKPASGIPGRRNPPTRDHRVRIRPA